MHEQPVSLAGGQHRLSGMIYEPEGTPVGSVVFCNPLFEERKSAHKIMVDSARALCAEGVSVLRFDYRGCGDSEGDFASFTPRDWVDDIRLASVDLKTRHPGCPLGLLGLRLGASLGVKAALEGPGIDFAVLWEPVPKGKDYLEQELRRKLMKEMMTFGKSQASREALVETLAAGQDIDFDGYAVTPALYRGLGDVDLTAQSRPPHPRCLMLSIGSSERPSQLISHLNETFRSSGWASEVKAVREQPFWNLVGLVPCPALIRETVAWIKQTCSTGTGA